VWGSTPTCRGFEHFNGFYSAASDYFTHNVGGNSLDYHFDFKNDLDAIGVYTTHRVTTAVQTWIAKQIQASASAKTFAYVAHEAVHGPLEVPVSYIEGPCEQLVPASHPSRRIYCGMVRKRHFLRHLYIKCIILPRQARDEHRENSKKVPFSLRCGRRMSRCRIFRRPISSSASGTRR
jgi:hypothetical protein